MHYLHVHCGIIHTDIKPENILLCINEEQIKTLAAEETNTKSAGTKLSFTELIHLMFVNVNSVKALFDSPN